MKKEKENNMNRRDYYLIGDFKIHILKDTDIEPCYRLIQYGKGLPIICGCSVCTVKNQTPEEAKIALDKIYKFNN